MASEEKHMILEAEALTIGYFRKKKRDIIAKGINFSIAEGELVGLVGANGIGKSTLLRTLSGMQPPLDGRISINGKSLASHNTLLLASQLSVVLTEGHASGNLTVEELVSLGRQPHTNWIGTLSSRDKEVIYYALEATETMSLKERKCFELSDGQLQRVIIARALAQDTPLVILDEPTTHLDLYHRAYVLRLLKKLANESGKTIIFSTHEIDLGIQLSDKMIVMASDAVYFNDPCTLISEERFASLFPKEVIHFDAGTGRFAIKK